MRRLGQLKAGTGLIYLGPKNACVCRGLLASASLTLTPSGLSENGAASGTSALMICWCFDFFMLSFEGPYCRHYEAWMSGSFAYHQELSTALADLGVLHMKTPKLNGRVLNCSGLQLPKSLGR